MTKRQGELRKLRVGASVFAMKSPIHYGTAIEGKR